MTRIFALMWSVSPTTRSVLLKQKTYQRSQLGSIALGHNVRYLSAPATNRLHHHYLKNSTNVKNQKLLSSPVLCCKRDVPLLASPLQSRSIFIGKIINYVKESCISDLESVLETVNKSVPVVGVRDLLVLTESTTGLPWWVTITVCTVALRTLLFVPAAIYLERWASGKENFNLDWRPVASKMYALGGDRSRMREIVLFRRSLTKEHNCQFYKFFGTVSWQITNIIVLSAGVRQCLLTEGGSGLRDATLPWGCMLGYPDPAFVLPIVNVLLNILLVEMEAWKTTKKNEELKMSLKRSNISKVNISEAERMAKIQLWLRRVTCVMLMGLYISVPTALTLLWTIMLIQTMYVRMELYKPSLRRKFGIPHRCHETPTPYRDFLLFLGTYLRRKSSHLKA